MIILGLITASLMGLTLGMVGAGGSILTVPILVYLFKINPITATSYSLVIVGTTALVGAIFYYKQKLIDFKSTIIFAIPASLGVVTVRSFVIPYLPQEILGITTEILIMLFFSSLMIISAIFMLLQINTQPTKSYFCKICVLIFGSFAIGCLTGIVGAGGGFLIIPALILLFNLETKKAIATSLLIIAINSLIGFKTDLSLDVKIDWKFLASFLFFTILGMIFGIFLGKKFNGSKLKKIFALLILFIATMIFTVEIYQLLKF